MTDNPYARYMTGARPAATAGQHGEDARTAEGQSSRDLFDELAEVRTKMENSRNILELLSRMNMNSADLLRNRDHHQKQIRMLLEKEFDIMERMSAFGEKEPRDPGRFGAGEGIPAAGMPEMRER